MNLKRVLFLLFLSCTGFGINSAQSAEVTLSPSVVASGRDIGQADGIFDSFEENSGSVSWNGFTERRVVAEIDISGLSGSVATALLTGRLSFFGDPILNANINRGLRLDAYPGNGSIEDADFSRNKLIGEKLFARGNSTFEFDVAEELRSAIEAGDDYLGLVLRESPECQEPIDCVTMTVSTATGALLLQVEIAEPAVGPIFQDRFEDPLLPPP